MGLQTLCITIYGVRLHVNANHEEALLSHRSNSYTSQITLDETLNQVLTMSEQILDQLVLDRVLDHPLCSLGV